MNATRAGLACALVLLAAVTAAHAGGGPGAALRTEVAAPPPAGTVRLSLAERDGNTVLVGRWRHHSRTLCCRAYPARVEVRGADGAILHSAPVEYTPRRLRHRPKTAWLLTFEHSLPADLPPDAVVRVRHGPVR